MKQSQRKMRKSVQELYVRARSVLQDVLCVADETTDNHLRFLAVLEVSGTNYILKSKNEQRRITAQFRLLLATLAHPLQFLIRVLPLDLDAYLQQFTVDDEETEEEAHRALRLAHIEHLHALEAERGGLLGRHFYVIVDAGPETQALFQGLPWQRKKRKQAQELLFQKATQQLNNRCAALLRQLSRMKLQVRRLRSTELINLEHSCVMAQRPPLAKGLIAGLDQPCTGTWADTPVVTRSENAQLQLMALEDPPVPEKKKPRRKKRVSAGPALPVFPQLADLVSPSGIKLTSHEMIITDAQTEYTRSILISNLSHEMPACWLRPLVEIDEPYLDISIHVRPVPGPQALSRMRESQNTYQAKVLYSRKKGAILDAHTEVQGEQVNRLIPKVAGGEEHMLDATMVVQCRAGSQEALNERCERILSLLRTMQVEAHPATFLHDEGYRACLPEGRNPLAMWESLFLDTTSAATLFPFFSSSLYMPEGGVMIGVTESNEPIILNRWALHNANTISIGPSGNGKSYEKKAEVERLWLQRSKRQFMIMDPEREFKDICDRVHGQWIRFAPGSGHRINPFDLYVSQEDTSPVDERGDRLAEKVQSLRELFQIMLARKGESGILPLEPEVIGFIEQAIFEAYRRVGITSKSNALDQDPPLLRDVYDIIEKQTFGEDKFNILPRLYQYVHGSHKSFFDGPTNIRLDAPFVVFDAKELDTELAPVALALIAEYVWLQSFNSSIPREFVIDEAGILSKYASWKRFMGQIVARARKHYLAISLMTQSIQDLEETILTNCATVNLFGHANARPLRELFDLSESETEFLETCGPGEGLVIVPTKRLTARFVANPLEHKLNSTNPVEKARWREEETETSVPLS
jgi:conjugal transfer ATP-binding protein TraC